MSYKHLHSLSKVELHCHLDGSLSLSAIRRLAQMAKIPLPEADADLRPLVMAPAHVTSLNDYLKTFDFVRPLLQTKEALRLAAYDVVEQAAREHVIYTEIRFAPELSMDQGLSALEVVEAVLDGFEAAMADYDITARALVCGLKQNADAALPIFRAVKELYARGLAGFDFAGNEVDYPTEELADIIKETQNLGLPMTFHAGECGCANNIAYGLDYGIKRFGHGTAIYKEPELMTKLVAADATLELCLISNLHTKAIERIEDYPYPQLLAAGANITINTDNRTVSDTNLTKEYQLFQDQFGTTEANFYSFNQTAIRSSFASAAEKEKLLYKIAQAHPHLQD